MSRRRSEFLNAWRELKRAIAEALLAGTHYAVRRRERSDDPPQHWNCACTLPSGCEEFTTATGAESLSDSYAAAPRFHDGGYTHNRPVGTFDPEDSIRYLREHPCKVTLYPPPDKRQVTRAEIKP